MLPQMKFVRALIAASVVSLTGLHAETTPTADPSQAAATARDLCDALIAAMKKGGTIGFAARKAMLRPEIEKDFDLPLMTRLIVGPAWRTVSPADRAALTSAFSDYSVTTYTQRFNSYSGERFSVDSVVPPAANGNVVVHTRLYTPDPVELDYLMHPAAGSWKIIDVYLNGSISELAARRSEYSSTLRSGGPRALITLLQSKTSELSK